MGLGSNVQGGFGNGKRAGTSGESTTVPQQVLGVANVVALKRGTFGRHFIALLADTRWLAGATATGAAWRGVIGKRSTDATADQVGGRRRLLAGGNYSFARTTDDALWFWGEQKGRSRFSDRR